MLPLGLRSVSKILSPVADAVQWTTYSKDLHTMHHNRLLVFCFQISFLAHIQGKLNVAAYSIKHFLTGSSSRSLVNSSISSPGITTISGHYMALQDTCSNNTHQPGIQRVGMVCL